MMSDGRDPFDWLRRHSEPPTPSPEETAQARDRLSHAIAAEQRPTPQRGVWSRKAVWAVAAAVVALVAAMLPILTRDPAQAALIEIARAARAASPIDVPSGSFILSESTRFDLAIRPGEELGVSSEFVAYQLPTSRRVWRAPEQRFFMVETIIGEPTFFSSEVEAAYYTAGIDEADKVGETITEQFSDVVDPLMETEWPTETDRLMEEMESFLQSEAPTPAQMVGLAADLLRETNPNPELRAALLEVLAQLPLDLEEQDDDSVTIGVTEDERLTTLTLSRTGELQAETITLLEGDPQLGIPFRTVIEDVRHQPTQIVESLPE